VRQQPGYAVPVIWRRRFLSRSRRWYVGNVGSVGLRPGDHVTVPDDDSGACVFVRPGRQSEGVVVEHTAVVDGLYTVDVGWVRYPDGSVKAWRYGVELRRAE
jgi:hypothetical protein